MAHSLAAGTSVGHYIIVEPLGAGGMGEVYKATDTRLDRTVAIKVLPPDLAGDPAVRARFEREAKAVAALSHAHICPLYEFGHECPQPGRADGEIDFLVLEYLDGETLAERLAYGALPLDQALRYAVEIAGALEKAHRHGVLHRDLKPGNIMLTKAGAKLLDFGLAKLKPSAMAELSALPTREASLTEQGTILGTFQYMAPEQLEGLDADARTDIFAFGVVVYEMVTGTKAFTGKSRASLIGSILKDEPPPISTRQSLSPPALDHVVGTCLAKDPDDRWQTAADLRRELTWVAGTTSKAGVSGISTAAAPAVGWRRPMLWVAGAAVVGLLVGGLAAWSVRRSEPSAPQPVIRVPLMLSPGDRPTNAGRRLVAISPDGRRVVYAANSRLYLREMDQLEATSIRGTEVGAGRHPFFSPDGQWVGFWAAGLLKKVSTSGGAPVTLCEVPSPWGASWGPDDTIVFGQGSEGIMRVSAAGGTPEILIPLDATSNESAWGPQILPGGRAVLFTLRTVGSWDDAQVVVQSLATGERRVLAGGTDARYVPTGHVVYGLGAALMALPFDLDRLEATGGPVPLVEGVARGSVVSSGAMHFGVSASGALVYVPVASLQASTGAGRLVWVDRQGRTSPLTDVPGLYETPRLSPDGQRLAVRLMPPEGGQDVWLLDLVRGTMTRLTFGGALRPLWSPDGERIMFAKVVEPGGIQIFTRRADGSGPEEQLTAGPSRLPSAVSADGKTLIFRQGSAGDGLDIGMMRLEGPGEPELLLQTAYDEHTGKLSPDDQWLAYVSNESGRDEIYVQPFPAGAKYQISTQGGVEPVWSRDGRELFYRSGEDLLAVPIASSGSALTPGTPAVLFEGPYQLKEEGPGASNYDVAPDGQRFVMIQPHAAPDDANIVTLTLVLNWFEELKARVPVR